MMMTYCRPRVTSRMGMRREDAGGTAYMPVPVDVLELEGAYEIRASLPGVQSESVEVHVERDTLRIRAECKVEEVLGEFLLRERAAGRFGRTLSFSADLDAEHTDASLVDGVLTIRIPKAESEKARMIPISKKN